MGCILPFEIFTLDHTCVSASAVPKQALVSNISIPITGFWGYTKLWKITVPRKCWLHFNKIVSSFAFLTL